MPVRKGGTTVWVVQCILKCGREASRRMLCQNHYRQAVRNGTIWEYPNLTYLDDYTSTGKKNLLDLIDWVYEFNVDKLQDGIKEYLTGKPELSLKFQPDTRAGSHGYTVGSQCFDCGDAQFSRGLCKNCYNDHRHNGTLGRYPTKDYTENVEGHVYYLLNYHLEMVIDVGVEWGVSFEEC